MARRRSRENNENLLVVLIGSPWQVSAVVAGVVFVIMRWLVPSQFNSPLLKPLANMISGLAPLAALLFLLIAGISFFLQKKQRHTIGNKPPQKNSATQYATNKNLSEPPDHVVKHKIILPDSDFDLNATKEIKKPQLADWSISLLRSLEWKRFEMLCAEYFRILGKRVETISHGADGGVDARVYANNSNVLEFAIQCKAWGSMVGVKPIRELFGVMAHESAGKGIFMATSWFSDDAKQFAEEHKDKLFLIDGEKFLLMLSKLPEDKRKKLLELATKGDFTTPTCASCGIKMVRRTGKGSEFWGCQKFPACRSTLKIATTG